MGSITSTTSCVPGPRALVAFVSLGCPKNLVDSEKMLGLLAEAGVVPTSDPADADVIIINTCGFVAAAKEESLAAIAQAARIKRARKSRVSRVVVAGCLATRMGDQILAHVPSVDAIIGVAERDQIVAAVLGTQMPPARGRAVCRGERGKWAPGAEWAQSPDTARLRLTPPHYAYLRISEGCSRGCSFCTIPAIRGPMRSKPAEMVLAEAGELIADGAVELNIIGQDTTGYGRDLPRSNGRLGRLLRRLDRLAGVRWLRLLYAYPNDFDDSIIEAMADCRHVVPYVDLPLQHVNDRILGLMRRRTTRAQIEGLLCRLRSRMPQLTLRTTLITGFPGETEAEHRELLEFITQYQFDMLGVFSYSQEPATAAAGLPGQIDEAVKQARRDELMRAQQKIAFARNAGWVGRRTEILIDQPADGWQYEYLGVLPGGAAGRRGEKLFIGRTVGQAPEVDSVTYVRGVGLGPGRLATATICGYRGYDLLATEI